MGRFSECSFFIITIYKRCKGQKVRAGFEFGQCAQTAAGPFRAAGTWALLFGALSTVASEEERERAQSVYAHCRDGL